MICYVVLSINKVNSKPILSKIYQFRAGIGYKVLSIGFYLITSVK